MFVSGTNSLREEWVRYPPVGNVLLGGTSQIEESGEVVTRGVLALYDCNEKGSMDGAKCTTKTEHLVIPSARKAFPCLANETGRRVVEFCDGVQVHLTWEQIKACRDARIICVLCVPATPQTRRKMRTTSSSARSRSTTRPRRALWCWTRPLRARCRRDPRLPISRRASSSLGKRR